MVSSLDCPSPHFRAMRSLACTLKKHELVLAKADKGSSLIILPRRDDLDKIYQFLPASQVSKIRFNVDEHNTAVRKAIKSNPLVILGDLDHLFCYELCYPLPLWEN